MHGLSKRKGTYALPLHIPPCSLSIGTRKNYPLHACCLQSPPPRRPGAPAFTPTPTPITPYPSHAHAHTHAFASPRLAWHTCARPPSRHLNPPPIHPRHDVPDPIRLSLSPDAVHRRR